MNPGATTSPLRCHLSLAQYGPFDRPLSLTNARHQAWIIQRLPLYEKIEREIEIEREATVVMGL
jgi:hypothetical protein